MDRPHVLILVGAVLVAGAITALALPAEHDSDRFRVVAVAVSIGALAFLAVVLSRYLSDRHARPSGPSPAAGTAAGYTEIEVRAMLRAMIATASSDGLIDDNEIATIRRVFCDVTGEAFDPVLFERVKFETLSPDYVIKDDLKLKHSPIGTRMRRLIVMACCHVLFADGSVQSAEIERITAIGELFGLDSAEFQELMRTARQDYLAAHRGP